MRLSSARAFVRRLANAACAARQARIGCAAWVCRGARRAGREPYECELEAAGAQLAADERDILSGVRAVAVKAAAAVPKRVANGVRSVATRRAYRAEIEQYTSKPGAAKRAEAAENPAWASVQTARDVHRPTAGRYLEATCEGFFECHGHSRLRRRRRHCGGHRLGRG